MKKDQSQQLIDALKKLKQYLTTENTYKLNDDATKNIPLIFELAKKYIAEKKVSNYVRFIKAYTSLEKFYQILKDDEEISSQTKIKIPVSISSGFVDLSIKRIMLIDINMMITLLQGQVSKVDSRFLKTVSNQETSKIYGSEIEIINNALGEKALQKYKPKWSFITRERCVYLLLDNKRVSSDNKEAFLKFLLKRFEEAGLPLDKNDIMFEPYSKNFKVLICIDKLNNKSTPSP